MRRLLLAALCSCILLGGACRAFPGHPVRLSQPRLPADAITYEPIPPTHDIADKDAAATLFRGLEGVLRPLEDLARTPRRAGRVPQTFRIARMESAVRKRYRRGGFGGPVRSVVVLGVIGTMPIPPRAVADLLCDPEVERAALAADAFWRMGTVYATPQVTRYRYRARLLDRGAGPFRYDLRFSFALERRSTSDGDGRIFLRYDPDVRPRPEHVTLFRGGCVLEPEGSGTRVTEILIVGTDLKLLPGLQGELMKLVQKTMRDRALHIWERAWRGR